MDDPKTPNPDDPEKDTGKDDLGTPENTDIEKSDDSKKDDAKEAQKASWLDKIEKGKVTLDDMPENLGWLKDDIKKELDAKKEKKVEKPKEDVDSAVNKALDARDAKKNFESLIQALKETEISESKDAQLKEEYEEYLEGIEKPSNLQKYKALKFACKVVGLKDVSALASERRRKGMQLPPMGGKKRETMSKDKETEMEKKLGGNLPPGFSGEKKK